NAVAGRAVVNAARGVGQIRGPREVALSRGDRIDLVIVERAEEVELVLAVIAPAARHAVALLLSAALFRIAVEGEGFDAGVVLTQNEVDHAGDRVGTVDRGRAVGQHFDALDRGK